VLKSGLAILQEVSVPENSANSTYKAVTSVDTISEKAIHCFEVDGVAVVICKFRDEFYAVENSCSHALSGFDEGRLRGFRIMCPLHGATFDIRDGSCTGAPARLPIRSFPLRVVDDMIEIDVQSAADGS